VDPTVRLVAWQRADEDRGHSLARVERLPDGWLCHGTEVLAGPGARLSCGFRVEVDDGWVTRSVEVWSVSGAGERRLRLTADDARRWWRDGPPGRRARVERGRVDQTYRRLAGDRWPYSDEEHGSPPCA
jgi:hypothetical protein